MRGGVKQTPGDQLRQHDAVLIRLCEDPTQSKSSRQPVRAQDDPLIPVGNVDRVLQNYPKMYAVDRDAED